MAASALAPAESADALSAFERDVLAQCEDVITRGLESFCRVGTALLTIRDQRLYRVSHPTFEAYCRDRWQLKRQRAYELMDAATVVANLSEFSDKPERESHAAALVPLAPDEQRIVWELARQTAPEGKVTAEHVRSLVNIARDVLAAGAVDPGTGEMVPWNELEPNQQRALLEANLAEETFERMERQRAHKRAHVSHNSGDNEWFTPAEYIEAARDAMGGIDLDPASTDAANAVVKAATFYTAAQNALTLPWFGRLWMNPPYSQPLIEQFSERLIAFVRAGEVPEAIALVNNATETDWFSALADAAQAVCFPKGRVRFWHLEKKSAQPLQGQAILYFGPHAEQFAARFARFGKVWR